MNEILEKNVQYWKNKYPLKFRLEFKGDNERLEDFKYHLSTFQGDYDFEGNFLYLVHLNDAFKTRIHFDDVIAVIEQGKGKMEVEIEVVN